jgi:hypothetical protein
MGWCMLGEGSLVTSVHSAKFEVSATLMLGILAIWDVSATYTCKTFIFMGW